MRRNYYKPKRKRKVSVFSSAKFLLLILILITVVCSIGFSHWDTELNMSGSVLAYREKLPVVIPPAQEDKNGVNRFSSNADIRFAGSELARVESEELVGDNRIITSVRQLNSNLGWLSFINPPKMTITLQITNNSGYDFTNGKIEEVDSRDTGNVLTGRSATLSTPIVTDGNNVTITITGTFNGSRNVATDTHYNYVISFDVNGEKAYFYYDLILLPKQ